MEQSRRRRVGESRRHLSVSKSASWIGESPGRRARTLKQDRRSRPAGCLDCLVIWIIHRPKEKTPALGRLGFRWDVIGCLVASRADKLQLTIGHVVTASGLLRRFARWKRGRPTRKFGTTPEKKRPRLGGRGQVKPLCSNLTLIPTLGYRQRKDNGPVREPKPRGTAIAHAAGRRRRRHQSYAA